MKSLIGKSPGNAFCERCIEISKSNLYGYRVGKSKCNMVVVFFLISPGIKLQTQCIENNITLIYSISNGNPLFKDININWETKHHMQEDKC